MKQIISMVVVLLVLGGAALLNPSADRHKDAIVAQYKAQNPIFGTLGFGHALAEAATYHNYVFFSTMTIGEEKISTGYVGRIDVSSIDIIEALPDDVRRQLRQ